MNLTKILPEAVRLHHNKKAVICESKEFNYKQFGTRVDKLSNVLLNLGLSKGEKVAILHKNCHYFLESYFGVMQIGAVLVPLNHYLSANELAFILNDSETRLLITSSNFSEKVKDVINGIKKDIKIILESD